MERGKITYRDRKRQINDFGGLIFGNITPTDIDGFIDFGDKLFVLLEFKCEGVDMPFGQRLAFERITDNLTQLGKPTLAIVATHTHPVDEDVDCANCVVDEYRYKGGWKKRKKKTTVKQLIDMFLKFYKYSGVTGRP